MNTVQLECFIAAAEYLNFTKAAEQIQITQPAISHQISSLESELGVKLFHRTSRNVQLTKAGTQFIQDAINILKISSGAKKRLQDIKEVNATILGIGCHNHLEISLLVPILSRLFKEVPNLQPTVKCIPFKSMANMLEDESLHVMFAYKTLKKKSPGIYFHLIKCPMVCICNKNHPFAKFKKLNASQLKGKMVMIEPHSVPQPIFKYQSELSFNRPVSDIIIGDGYESALALVKAGAGFMVFSDIPVIREEELSYIPINEYEPVSFGMYYKTQKGNQILKRFLQIAKEYLLDYC